jgi:hypothetical protein
VGCRNCDLVEAELRSRDHELREVRDELHRMQACNDTLHREIKALRRNCTPRTPCEESSLIFSLKSVALGRQTGGWDDDDCPGDEALQVVLEPRDPDGHVIKAPGILQVQALEISPEGLKRPLAAWQVSPENLRRTWKSGLLSTGYFVILPWKAWPTTEKVRVIAVFTLADGRTFEADRDVSVRLTPISRRKALPVDPFLAPPPGPVEQAPPPRPVAPAQPAGLWQTRSLDYERRGVELLPPLPRNR